VEELKKSSGLSAPVFNFIMPISKNILVALSIVVVGVSVSGLPHHEGRAHEQELRLDNKGEFTLKVNSEDPEYVVMEMSAPTNGYVAIGLSPDGGMANSDIVLGWVDQNGQAQLKDMYGIGNTKPKEDPSQDYELLSGVESGGRTTIRFRRRWNLCDSANDRSFENGVLKMIWAYNNEDPKLADEDGVFRPPYHFSSRGAKDVKIQVQKGTGRC